MLSGVIVFEANPSAGVNMMFYASKKLWGGDPKKFSARLNVELAKEHINFVVDTSYGDEQELKNFDIVVVTSHAMRWIDKQKLVNSAVIDVSASDFFENNTVVVVNKIKQNFGL
ncbi:hypothetical protein EQG49_06590 [Periweissella cryptocerci]|uniref:Uncharacterized protein n=1 Tax=Periweissella cryptocerci TaxID=2506420 RepID=A0A4P6YTQ7_9LACO|nr:hypothetical protein [Periweissella cryptocerci]QBO36149.1 hypothetical protein EQG49_06590 [Periweissella cryptocerci]